MKRPTSSRSSRSPNVDKGAGADACHSRELHARNRPAEKVAVSAAAAQRTPVRWSAGDEARLLAAVLCRATADQIGRDLGRSASLVSQHLSLRGWPSPVALLADPTLAAQVRLEVVLEHPRALKRTSIGRPGRVDRGIEWTVEVRG